MKFHFPKVTQFFKRNKNSSLNKENPRSKNKEKTIFKSSDWIVTLEK